MYFSVIDGQAPVAHARTKPRRLVTESGSLVSCHGGSPRSPYACKGQDFY